MAATSTTYTPDPVRYPKRDRRGLPVGPEGYWIDPHPTVLRSDPSVAGMLAAIAAIPANQVQAVTDRNIALRRAALGW